MKGYDSGTGGLPRRGGLPHLLQGHDRARTAGGTEVADRRFMRETGRRLAESYLKDQPLMTGR